MELNDELLSVLGRYIQRFTENYILFREGEVGNNFYVILEGEVEIYKTNGKDNLISKITLSKLGKGDFFGEMAVFTGMLRSGTARTITACKLVVLQKKDVEYVVRSRPLFALKIIEGLCKRLEHTDRELVVATAGHGEAPLPVQEKPAEGSVPGEKEEGLSQKEVEKVLDKAGKIQKANWAELTCSCCAESFKQYWPSFDSFRLRGRESDFKPVYEEENMLFYNIWVCPGCGYAAYRKDFGQRQEEKSQKARSAPFQAGKELKLLTGQRQIDHAIMSYLQAIQCYNHFGVPAGRMAVLYHQLAWLYREKSDREKEFHYLNLALNNYLQLYEKGEGEIPQDLGEPGLVFLIGELNWRLENSQEAVKWLQKAVRHPQLKEKPVIEKLIRNQLEMAAQSSKK